MVDIPDIVTLVILLIIFQLKHYVADYVLQTRYMLGKFLDKGWEKPLLAHAGVHAVITLLIALILTAGSGWAWILAVIDLIVHSAVDRLKVLQSKGISTKESMFWKLLGADQALHHLTHYGLIVAIIYIS